MKKKILGIMFVFAILVTLNICAQAADVSDLTFDSSTGTITGSRDEIVGSLIIPSEIKGVEVKAIGDNAFERTDLLTSVAIPDSVTKIGYAAFAYCSNLQTVDILGDNVELAGAVFEDCSRLSYVNAVGVSKVGDRTFQNCISLKTIDLSENLTEIQADAFQNCKSLEEIMLSDKLTEIDGGAFKDCENLREISTLKNVERINYRVFKGCKSLQSINLGEKATEIDKQVFEDCISLKNVVMPDGLTYIDSQAFRNCISLETINIPESVTDIGSYAFENCVKLKSVNLPDSITNLNNNTFDGCTGLESVKLSAGIEHLGSDVFNNCTSLKNVMIPSGIKRLENIFSNCPAITEITIPDTLTGVYSSVFDGCVNLENIYVDENNSKYTSIDGNLIDKTNENYWALVKYAPGKKNTTYTLPDNITSIQDYAFAGCEGINNIVLHDKLLSIYDYAFDGCPNLTYISVDENNQRYCSVDGNLYDKDKRTINGEELYVPTGLIRYAPGKSDLSYTVPDTVSGISNGAFNQSTNLQNIYIDSVSYMDALPYNTYITTFSGCDKLKSVALPEGITTLGPTSFSDNDTLKEIELVDGFTTASFKNCSVLESITIPASITDIEIKNCPNLKNITVSEDNENYASIDGNLYNKDKTQFIKYALGKNDSEFTVPDYVTSILYYAFDGCVSVESLILPDSLDLYGGLENFKGLKSIKSNIHSAEEAIENCENLSELILLDSTLSLSNLSDVDVSRIESLTLPSTETHLNKSHLDVFTGLKSLKIDENNSKYCSIDNNVFSKDGKTLIYYVQGAKDETEYTIPSGVTAIDFGAFMDSTNLESIAVPDGIVELRSSTFAFCKNLTYITLPNSLKYIGSSAFYDCEKLNSLKLPNVIGINEHSFEGCKSLTSVKLRSVGQIGKYAFKDCTALERITLGEYIEGIAENAFQNCEKLSDVYYADTEVNWGYVVILDDNTELKSATVHYDSKTVPPIITAKKVTEQDGQYTFEVQLEDVEDDFKLITVLYDAEQISGMNSADIAEGDTVKSVDVTADTADKAKIFVWDSLSGMRPLCDTVTVDGTEFVTE